ncbi:MAG: hypothetical protein M3P51_08545 [Chloroflexota bacterium]|nr:hypothetical protein [Chloroflexota bacterium]
MVLLNYPLTLSFKVLSIGPQISVTDSTGRLVAYVKQKALRLKEDVSVFADEGQQELLYRIQADRAFDFNANYSITQADGMRLGSVRREGGRSLWKATYQIVDASGMNVGLVHEENPWLKLADALANQVPGVGLVSGYFLNPAYLVDLNGATVLRVKKQPAFLEGRFSVEKRGEAAASSESLMLPSVITTVLLERDRG